MVDPQDPTGSKPETWAETAALLSSSPADRGAGAVAPTGQPEAPPPSLRVGVRTFAIRSSDLAGWRRATLRVPGVMPRRRRALTSMRRQMAVQFVVILAIVVLFRGSLIALALFLIGGLLMGWVISVFNVLLQGRDGMLRADEGGVRWTCDEVECALPWAGTDIVRLRRAVAVLRDGKTWFSFRRAEFPASAMAELEGLAEQHGANLRGS